jgi:hypothetical protein
MALLPAKVVHPTVSTVPLHLLVPAADNLTNWEPITSALDALMDTIIQTLPPVIFVLPLA